MEPITLSLTFATIVTLIGQFRSERKGDDQVDFNEFLEWLVKTQHLELKELLETNTKATIGIKALLKEDRELLISKLESLDCALTGFASGIGGFSELAEALNPTAKLSTQAIDLLRQFENSEGSKILELHHAREIMLLILDGRGGQIEVTEPRFIEDDLKTLIELGLLRHDLNSKGDNLYIFTRVASELVRSMNHNKGLQQLARK